MSYASSLLKQVSESELILIILQRSVAAYTAARRLELSLPGGNSFDFQSFSSVSLQKRR